MKKAFQSALLLTVALMSCLVAWAQPQGFQYQGVARDAGGAILANESLNLRFVIREGSAGGTNVFEETHTPTTNDLGLFAVVIGEGVPVSGNFDLDWLSDQYFLEVQINGASIPATRLSAVPYAKVATDMRLDHLEDVSNAAPANGQVLKWNGSEWAPAVDNTGGGGGPTYSAGDGIAISGANAISATLGTSIQTAELDNLSVTDAKLANNAVTTTKIAANAVTTTQIANNAVTTGKIGPGAVTTAQIAANAVTTAQIAANAVTTAQIANGAVTAAKLNQSGAANGQVLKWNGTAWAPAVDNAGGGGPTYTAGDGIAISGANAISATLGTSIQTAELDDLSVNSAKLANNAVVTAKILDNAVTTPKIANNAITTVKIAASAVTTNELANNAVTTAKIAASAVTANELANNAVTTAKIANGAVTTAKLGQSGAANGQVLKWNGAAWAPAADDAGGASQWTTTGNNIHYTTGNVGIGDATPANTLTVGNGDKFQVSGIDGDILLTDPQGTLRFPAVTVSNAAPMIQMFTSGTQNASRMVISHSPSFPNWGLEYKDTTDVFYFRDSGTRKFAFELGSGRMGIGVENPVFPLDMTGRMRIRSTGNINNSPGIWFQNNAGTFDRAFLGMSAPDSVIGIFSQHLNKWAIEFEVMREPRIGINIPAGSPPRAELHLYHTNFGGSNDGIRIQNEGANGHYWNLYTSNTTGHFEFFKQGIKRATINLTSGAYTAVSDARLKTNVSLLGSVLPQVMNLQAKTYQYTDSEDPRYFTGFIAQELEKEFPQFVYFGGDDQKYYTVDYAGMSVVALKAIQEQQSVIDAQAAQLASQEARLQQLEAMVRELSARTAHDGEK